LDLGSSSLPLSIVKKVNRDAIWEATIMMTDDLPTMSEKGWNICGSVSATPINREPFQGLSPVRKRLQFPTFANHRNSKLQRARRLLCAIRLYFVLCVSLSALAFTWMLASTVEHNHLAYNPFDASSLPNLRNPFQRVSVRRNSLQQSDEYQTQPQEEQQQQREEAERLVGRSREEQDTVAPFSNSQVPNHLRIPDEELVVQVISTRYVRWHPPS
jgi:hypothetical protein